VKMVALRIKQSKTVETDIGIVGATGSEVHDCLAKKSNDRCQSGFLTFRFTYQILTRKSFPCVFMCKFLVNNSFDAKICIAG
jgi:hypothetical protein